MAKFNRKNLIGIILFIITIIAIAFFDKALAVGIILIGLLTVITFLILSKTKTKSKTICLLFLIVLLIYLGTVLFVYYANFQPFSGGEGDYIKYNYQAQEIAQRIHQGNFSLEGLNIGHYYPVIIGYLYAFTLPEMLVGQLFAVWLAAISVLLVYLIVLEIGGSKKWAFLMGLITAIYPSYLFWGTLLLKDTLVVPLVLAGLLLTLKLIKNFSWRNFVIFYIILGAVIHFRFYIGYSLLFTFILCWSLLCKLNLKKKFVHGIIIVILLGFLPQFSGYGYYGIKTIDGYLNPKAITFYREAAYTPLSSPVAEVPEVRVPEVQISKIMAVKTYAKEVILQLFPNIKTEPDGPIVHSSTIELKTEIDNPSSFLVNCLKSFVYVSLGPLPWQIQRFRQLFVLLETIPWYFLLFFIIKGAFITLKRKRIALPLLVFSVMSLGILALYVSNFGIITRIRIPSFIALLCLIPLGFEKLKYIKSPFLET